MKEQLYYIQDTRSYVGNSMLFWGINRKGYTSNISEAGKYTKKEADSICERDSDRAWPVEYIASKIKGHVDMQDVDRKYSGTNDNLTSSRCPTKDEGEE